MADSMVDAVWEAMDEIADTYTGQRCGLLANQVQALLQGVGVWLGREMMCGRLWGLITETEQAALVTQVGATLVRSLEQGGKEVLANVALYGPGEEDA